MGKQCLSQNRASTQGDPYPQGVQSHFLSIEDSLERGTVKGSDVLMELSLYSGSQLRIQVPGHASKPGSLCERESWRSKGLCKGIEATLGSSNFLTALWEMQ